MSDAVVRSIGHELARDQPVLDLAWNRMDPLLAK
jgi:hypothetical protein